VYAHCRKDTKIVLYTVSRMASADNLTDISKIFGGFHALFPHILQMRYKQEFLVKYQTQEFSLLTVQL